MSCEAGERLQIEFARASKEEGDYGESLQGVAGSFEHQTEKDRLCQQTGVARRALLDHQEVCAECDKKKARAS
jgi:hypothetical protein